MQTRICFSLLLMAATACYSQKTVGVSKGEKPEEPAPTKAKFPSQIVGRPGELVNFSFPRAGDIDGDGFDDFVLWAEPSGDSGSIAPNSSSSLYLFYGRDEFPQQLSTADADAVFPIDLNLENGPVGDLNGDGLGDLMLVRTGSVEFVFGNKQRFHGVVPPNSGVVWMAGELPPPFAAGLTTQFMTQGAGDVDADGCADLIVGATTLLAPQADGTGGGLVMRQYLIRGHRGEWRSAVFDPSWAAAGFGFDASTSHAAGLADRDLLYAEPAGDLDGDGRADLLASTERGSLVFYGRREYPREVTSSEAEARLLSPGAGPEFTADTQWSIGRAWGDLDGDGMDDLALVDPNTNQVGFVYGKHWSGEVQLAAELEVQFEQQGVQSLQNIATGDIDGDGFPELLLNVIGAGSIEFDAMGRSLTSPASASAFYLIRGTGKRLTGRLQLSENDRWQPRGVVLPSAPEAMLQLAMAGDIDGDGSQDVLTNLVSVDADGFAVVTLYLIPSTPRSPD